MFSSRHGAESPLPPHPRGVPETKGLPSTRLTVPAPPGLRQEGTLHARVGFRFQAHRPASCRQHLPRPSRVPGTQADFCFAAAPPRPCEDRRSGLPQHASHLAPLTPVRGSADTDPAPAHACVEHATRSMPGGYIPAGCPAQAKPRAAAGSRALLSAKIPRASKAKRHAPSTPRRIRNTARQRPTGPRARRKEHARRLQGHTGYKREGHARPLCPRDYEGSGGIRREGHTRPLWGHAGSGPPGIWGKVSVSDRPEPAFRPEAVRKRTTGHQTTGRPGFPPGQAHPAQAAGNTFWENTAMRRAAFPPRSRTRRTRPAGHGPEARRKAGGAASLIVWKRPAR